MTSNTNKLRAVFLTALMIGSVMVAGIAFTGGAAAQPDAIQSATHYEESDGGSVIEVVLDSAGSVENNTSAVITDADGDTIETFENDSITASSDQRWSIETDELYNNVSEVELENVNDTTDVGPADVTYAASTVNTTDDGNTFEGFSGSNIALEGDDVGQEFDIDGPDTDLTRGAGDNSQVYVLDTEDFETGEYNITNRDTETEVVLDLGDLGLGVAGDESSFTTAQSLTATAESDTINRDLTVELLNENGNTVEDSTQEAFIDSDGNVPLNFSEAAEGTYTVQVTDQDTGVTAESDAINVTPAGDTVASFPEGTFTENRGDTAAITVDLQNTDEAEIHVGSPGVSYVASMNVTDENDDGEVTVYMNTYTAGQSEGNETDVYSTHSDSDDTISGVSLDTPELGSPLAGGDYEINASAGGEETGVGTLLLDDRSTDGASTSVAPGEAGTDSVSEITDAVTERDNVAAGDKAVLQFDATGIYGYVDDDYDLSEGAEDDGVFLNIDQTPGSTAPNADRNSLTVSNASYVFDSANDTFYAVIDTDDFDVSDGEVYQAELTVNESNPYIANADATESVNTTFTVEDVTASFNGLNDDDVLAVAPESAVNVSGQTNLAPGTELNIRARSTVQGNSFIKNPSATVQDDGSISAELDFSGYEEDTEFTWAIRQGSTSLTSPDGLISSDAGGTQTTDPGTTTEQTTTQQTTEQTTTEDPGGDTTTEDPGGDTTTEDGDGGSGSGIPGFGVGIALVALLGAALLALRE